MKTNTCDRCGQEAVAEMKTSTSLTTEIKLDLCEECLVVYKELMRAFTKQEIIVIHHAVEG